ncbi:MAG: hypothetical protein QXK12_05445 [Candidatus Nezhaarchaeales archaeon]
MLSFEDGYEVARLIAERKDVARMKVMAEALSKATKAYTGSEEEKEFLLGLSEGLNELAKFKEEVIRLQNLAKTVGVSLEITVKYT